MNYLLASVLATQIAIGWNFTLVELLRRGQGVLWARPRRAAAFFAISNVDLVLRLPLLALLVDHASVHVLTATVTSILVVFAFRFLLVDRILYAARQPRNGPQQRHRLDPVASTIPSPAATE